MVSLITKTPPVGAPHITLRFRYVKTGALSYISHLDVLRTFIKALNRAGLPLAYSEGFSPHPKLTFAAPLAVGQESACEYLDVRLSEDSDPLAAMAALNATLPSGLRITAAGYPLAKFTVVDRASYEITLLTHGADSALAERAVEVLSRRPLFVFKRSKAGDRDVDVSGNILSVTGEYREGTIHLALTLRAEGGAFLNTDYLLSILRRELGILSHDPLHESATVVRTSLANSEGIPFEEGDAYV